MSKRTVAGMRASITPLGTHVSKYFLNCIGFEKKEERNNLRPSLRPVSFRTHEVFHSVFYFLLIPCLLPACFLLPVSCGLSL
jgi:hypothetical protein